MTTVEKPAFLQLVHGLNPNVKVMTRKTLSSKLDEQYNEMLDVKKAIMTTVPYVCTTADIWSVHSKSYMGMTVHFLQQSDVGELIK